MKNRRSRLTAPSLICSCGTLKDLDPGDVVNLSWAGWVVCKDTLKMESHSVVCFAQYGGSD